MAPGGLNAQAPGPVDALPARCVIAAGILQAMILQISGKDLGALAMRDFCRAASGFSGVRSCRGRSFRDFQLDRLVLEEGGATDNLINRGCRGGWRRSGS